MLFEASVLFADNDEQKKEVSLVIDILRLVDYRTRHLAGKKMALEAMCSAPETTRP